MSLLCAERVKYDAFMTSFIFHCLGPKFWSVIFKTFKVF
jgi:hypothetical protein